MYNFDNDLFMTINFNLCRELCKKLIDVNKHKEIYEYVMSTLRTIEELINEVNNLLKYHSPPELNFSRSIIGLLDNVMRNHIDRARYPKDLDQIVLDTVEGIFSPIRSSCEKLYRELRPADQKTVVQRKLNQEKNILLANALRDEQERIKSLSGFTQFFQKLSHYLVSKNCSMPDGCYFVYAWPTACNSESEEWVKEFLITLCNHLKDAGIKCYLDIRSNPLGYSIYQYMENTQTSDYVLLFGTESLMEKHRLGTPAVCTELIHVKRKRKADQRNNLYRVFPILLTGTLESALPAEYERYITINDWREKGYLNCLKKLIYALYGFKNNDYYETFEKIWNAILKDSLDCTSRVKIANLENEMREIRNKIINDHQVKDNSQPTIIPPDSPITSESGYRNGTIKHNPTNNESGYRNVTIKYDPNKIEKWTKPTDNPDYSFSDFSANITPGVADDTSSLLNAADKGNLKGVEAALRNPKTNIDGRRTLWQDPNNSCTALIIAASKGRLDIVDLLVRKGADVTIRTFFFRKTAWQCAMDSEHIDVANYLMAHQQELSNRYKIDKPNIIVSRL